MVLAWPLPRNNIRRQVRNNTYGMVRNSGTKAHQGWDLTAMPMTPCYAIADGKISDIYRSSSYGNCVELEFRHGSRIYYALYCHLSLTWARKGEQVRKGQQIGSSGNTGNAAAMTGEDQHLHFEIRTISTRTPPSGLSGRVDPASLYGFTPQAVTIFQDDARGGKGLKLRGVNLLGKPE